MSYTYYPATWYIILIASGFTRDLTVSKGIIKNVLALHDFNKKAAKYLQLHNTYW